MLATLMVALIYRHACIERERECMLRVNCSLEFIKFKASASLLDLLLWLPAMIM